MVGSVSSSPARAHGDDRFYNPPALRRQLRLLQQQQPPPQQQQQQQQPPQQQQKPPPQQQHKPPPQQQQRLQRPAKPKQRAAAPAELEAREVESRVDSDDSSSKLSMSAPPSPPPTPLPPASNLDRFIQSTTPVVLAQCFLKVGRRNDSHPYFNLGDLWESFREWSAYGAGVPLVLNVNDSVIQYYVPYLSGIQLYVPMVPRDTGSGGSSDVGGTRHITARISSICLGDKPNCGEEGSSSVVGEICNSPGALVFEFLERDPPYGREPLADKISLLARQFPELKTYKSCDLLPESWMSVAWYPIYRIPTGPTLRDLDACFLTFHELSTSSKDISGHPGHSSCNIGNIHNASGKSAKLSLPVFGLASYKLKGSVWASNGSHGGQQPSSLLQKADKWLRDLQVDHPDFSFFLSHNGTYRR